jgi:hypothetical protein
MCARVAQGADLWWLVGFLAATAVIMEWCKKLSAVRARGFARISLASAAPPAK